MAPTRAGVRELLIQVGLPVAACGAADARQPSARRAGRVPEDPRRIRPASDRSAEDVRDAVGAGHPERAAVPRDRGQEPAARDREPAQERVPRQHVARAAHAAQRHHRLFGGPVRASCSARSTTSRPNTSATSGFRPASAVPHQRHSRSVEDRGGTDGVDPSDFDICDGIDNTMSLVRERAQRRAISCAARSTRASRRSTPTSAR